MALMMLLMVVLLVAAPGHMGGHGSPDSAGHASPVQQQPAEEPASR